LSDRPAGVGAEGPEHLLAETAAALPPDDPPGVRERSTGCGRGRRRCFSLEEPMANSSMLSLPHHRAGAEEPLHTVASKGGMKPSRMRDPAVVSTPSSGRCPSARSGRRRARSGLPPGRGGRRRHARRPSARSVETRRKAPSRPSVASMRASTARVSPRRRPRARKGRREVGERPVEHGRGAHSMILGPGSRSRLARAHSRGPRRARGRGGLVRRQASPPTRARGSSAPRQ